MTRISPTYPFERSSYWPEVRSTRSEAPAGAPKSAILEAVASPREGAQGKAPLKLRLEQTPEALRSSVLREEVQKMLGEVLRSSPGKLPDPNTGFFDLGMDSIMTVEFKKKIEDALGVKLPVSASFNYPTIAELVEHLLRHPTVLSQAPVPPANGREKTLKAAGPATSVETQIEEEIAALNRLL